MYIANNDSLFFYFPAKAETIDGIMTLSKRLNTPLPT